MTLIHELAAAKINLALHVVGQRDDGYHELESLEVFASLGDRLDVLPARTDSLTVTGAFAADVPTDAGNLVVKARDAYRRAFPGDAAPPLAVTLDKVLPVASGIGGGSSDAAAMLRAMARLAGRASDDAAVIALAATLGADVPMCLIGRPAIASGIGDRLAPVAGFPALNLVLVNPGIETHTPAIFKALRAKANPPPPPLPSRLTHARLIAWLGKTRNDLAAPALACVPAIGDALGALSSTGADFARMSGSGATCFGLFPDGVAAQAAAARIGVARPGWFVSAVRTLASPAQDTP